VWPKRHGSFAVTDLQIVAPSCKFFAARRLRYTGPISTVREVEKTMVRQGDHWIYTRDLDEEYEQKILEIEGRISSRLDVLADRIETGQLNAPLAVLRRTSIHSPWPGLGSRRTVC
jgi:hypothetical protein